MSAALLLLICLSSISQTAQADDIARFDTDVMVYGATPGGIAATVSAARSGHRVMLIEPTGRIGGLVTGGLSHTDFHSFESLSGSFLEFAKRVERHYVQIYGPDSQQVRDCFRGTFAEPKVNLVVFEQMLSEQPQVIVKKQSTLADVSATNRNGSKHIDSVAIVDSNGTLATFRARVFIDASYEGDLLAQTGVPWKVGREGRAEYGESLAPEHADAQLQAYNFRFIMTRDPTNRVSPVAPSGYRREDFLDVLPALESGRVRKIFGYPSNCLFKAQTPPLPNGKYDINDVSGGLVRLSLPGKNLDWPNGDTAARERIFAEHRRDQIGLLYFLQNDDAVPVRFRDEAREWGWCRDEFTETDHLPPQLYVREARRMLGVHVFTQKDSEHAPGDARAVLHRNSIAMGDYGNNCHGTGHEGPRFGGRHTGEFYNPVPPYQIPFGVMLPRAVDNLLVPVAASSSHIGFCALRLEPIWMSLGQAAGHASSIAVNEDLPIQGISVPALQRRLHRDKSATIYVSDVHPDSPDFSAVQWWGTAGGLHRLAPMPSKPGQRGKNIHGQYFEANPGHAADLDQRLDPQLARRWAELAKEIGVEVDKLPIADSLQTRGDFIRSAWRAASSSHP